MSNRRASGGEGPAPRVVARGTVLVDPRAAVAKLREYLLPDPALYAVELVRSVTAAGATRVTIENDSNEFTLTADGEPPHARELSRLLDHLFSSSDVRLRLLALAVNTALGLSPHFVDLYTTEHDGPSDAVTRVRWRAAAVSDAVGHDKDGVEGALAAGVEAQSVARPEGMPAKGLRVHVRERFGARVFREYFTSEPAESRLVRARVVAPGPLVTVRGKPMAERRPPGFLFAEYSGGETLRATVALLADGAELEPERSLELCELGALLEARALSVEDLLHEKEHLPAGELTEARPQPRRVLPLWVRVDAKELVTNASRSQVRFDAKFAREVQALLDDALGRMLERTITLLDQAPDSYRVSLRALLWALGGSDWMRRVLRGGLPPALAALDRAPLFPLATGGYTTAREVAASEERQVYRGREALPAELAPWLPGVLHVRGGDPVLQALVQANERYVDAGGSIEAARNARVRHTEFLALARRLPRVPSATGPKVDRDVLLRVPLGIAPFEHGAREEPLDAGEGEETEAYGELVLRASRLAGFTGREPAWAVTPYLDGRPLPTEEIPGEILPIELAVQCRAMHVKPAYAGVQRDREFRAAIAGFVAKLTEGLAVLAAFTSDPGSLAPEDPRLAWVGPAARDAGALRPRLVREALAATVARSTARQKAAALEKLFTEHPALAKAPAFPRADGAPAASVAELTLSMEPPPHVLLFVDRARDGRFPTATPRADKRPVLALDEASRGVLVDVLPSRGSLVAYDVYSAQPTTPQRMHALSAVLRKHALAPWLVIAHRDTFALVAPAERAAHYALLHRAVPVEENGAPGGAFSYVLAVDEPQVIPPKHGALTDAHVPPHVRELREAAPYDFAHALVRAHLGDRELAHALALPVGAAPPPAARRLLLEVLASLRVAKPETPVGLQHKSTAGALRALLDEVPLVPVVDASGGADPVSPRVLRERAERTKVPLPFLTSLPSGVDFDDFAPVILAYAAMEPLVERACGVSLVDATSTLPPRRAARSRRVALEAILARPATPFALGGLSADAGSASSSQLVCAATDEGSSALLEVYVRGRVAFSTRDVLAPLRHLPLRMLVHFENEATALAPEYDRVTDAGFALVDNLARRALRTYFGALADRVEEGEEPPPRALALLSSACAEGVLKGSTALRDRLAEVPLFRTPAGGLASARACCTHGRGKALYATEAASPWIPPADPRVEPDVVAALVPAGVTPSRFADALTVLTGQPAQDATRELAQVQRQRAVLLGSVALVKPPGDAPWPSFAARIEGADPSLGAGEVRLTPNDPDGVARAHVYVFERGALAHEWAFAAPFAFHVALESALLERSHFTRSAPPERVFARVQDALHKMIAKGLAGLAHATRPPPWALPALRWHLLSRKGHALAVSALALFEDSEHRPMTLGEIEGEEARHRAVAVTTERPREPCPCASETPRRVLVLSAAELGALRTVRGVDDRTSELAEVQKGRAWAALPPAMKIKVRPEQETPRGSARYELDPARDGHEGEVLLLPASYSAVGTIWWWRNRRPLGTTEFSSIWPAWIALEEPLLTPTPTGVAPREDGVLDAGLRDARKLVREALRARLGPPSEALVSVDATDSRSPAYARRAPKAVGWLWLDPRADRDGEVRVTGYDGATFVVPSTWTIPGARPSTGLPVHGALWIAHGAGNPAAARELVDDVVHWSYAALLDELVRSLAKAPEGAALFHLVRAAVEGFLTTPTAETWGKATALPGSMTTFSALRTAAREGRALTEVSEGDRRALTERLVIARSSEPWAAWLRARGRIAPEKTEAKPAPEPPKPAPVEKPVAKEPERKKPTPAPLPPTPAEVREGATDSLAAAVYEGLRRHGFARAGVTRVRVGPAAGGREPFRYEASTQTLWMDPAHALVRAGLEMKRPRAVRVLVLAASGVLNRALEKVRDDDEQRALDEMLDQVIAAG